MIQIKFFFRYLFPILSFLSILTSCDARKEVTISGNTMGTTYHIKAVVSSNDIEKLKSDISKELIKVNHSMSVFDPKSEISQFNQLTDTTQMLAISDDFYKVLSIAAELYSITDGAWDGTVNPLVNLWGFGTTKSNSKVPSDEEIQSIKQNIGFDKVILEDHRIGKKNPIISISLASIAKGYGVDQIAKLLHENSIENFLVEIGGEVAVSGKKLDNSMWRVGINRPTTEASLDDVYEVITVNNQAIATSGDYRNYFEIEKNRYSHIIDPITGCPIKNNVSSVTVIADNCTLADGLATALMVMGHEKGLALINRLNNVEAMFIVAGSDNKFTNHYSDGFQSYISKTEK